MSLGYEAAIAKRRAYLLAKNKRRLEMASYMTAATRKAYEEGRAEGRADERFEWEALPLKSIKALTDELADTQKMLEANRKEITRLNEVIKTVTDREQALKADLASSQAALRAFRASPGKNAGDERTDRVVNAIRDMDRNLDGTLRRVEQAVNRVGLRI